jgi:hypothetical protein
MARTTLLLLALCTALSFAADLKITPEERAEEARWLASLGVKTPASGWPLEEPFATPFTRRSLIVPTAWYRQPQPSIVRADLFREDVKLLHKIMETAYGGWEVARRRGWNWDRFFRDWDDALVARGSRELPVTEAFAPWRKLMAVQLDNHSGPLAENFLAFGHSFSWSAVLAKPPAEPCTEFRNAKGAIYAIESSDPAQQPKRREDFAGKPVHYIVSTLSKGPVAAVHCGAAWIPAQPAWMPEEDERAANVRALAQTEKDVPTFRSISSRIAYIRFPSFFKPDVERILELEETLKGARHNEELLVVDLRGNGGGDRRVEAISYWTTLPSFGAARRVGASCLYPALRWGYGQISSSGLKPPISAMRRSSLQQSLDELQHDDDPACPPKFNEIPANSNYTDHRYPQAPAGRTRVLALIDNFCGSDCESAVQLIAAIPGSVIAGVNTFGVAQYIQPGYFILPRTRLGFRIALGTSDPYGDGRSFDGYGFDPDILLPSKEDQSPEAIIKLAERLLPRR